MNSVGNARAEGTTKKRGALGLYKNNKFSETYHGISKQKVDSPVSGFFVRLIQCLDRKSHIHKHRNSCFYS